MNLEASIAALADAINRNTDTMLLLINGKTAAPAPAATVETPAAKPEKKVTAKTLVPPVAAAPIAALPHPEPEAPAEPEPEADPDLDDAAAPTEAPAKVPTVEELREAIRARLKEDGFKVKFAALRKEFKVEEISQLTDANRGTFLEAVHAL